MDPSDLLTPAQLVRKYPFMTRSTLYGVFKAGLLPFYAVPSRRGSRGKYLVKESEFLAWLETNRRETGAVGSAPLKLKHL